METWIAVIRRVDGRVGVNCSWVSGGKRDTDETHRYTEPSPTKSQGAPPILFLSPTSPGFSSNASIGTNASPTCGRVGAICTSVDNMPSQSTDPSITRGGKPNSTPVRRRRRTGHSLNHSHNNGTDARSCPHCGRTFKRTEHLERHVRTRQSSHSLPHPKKLPNALG